MPKIPTQNLAAQNLLFAAQQRALKTVYFSSFINRNDMPQKYKSPKIFHPEMI
jgi:hypothetical protein